MNRAVLTLILLAFALSACRGGIFTPNASLMDKAEGLANEEHYDEAIALYQQHIQNRLAVKDRPEWENPYVYLLSIGDIELRRQQVSAALMNYEQAEKQGVSAPLVSDRLRGIAEYYESRHELEQAVEFLQRYRERDPLLFDGMLDRLSKQIVAEEDSREKQ